MAKCPRCQGTGKANLHKTSAGTETFLVCPKCEGSGEVNKVYCCAKMGSFSDTYKQSHFFHDLENEKVFLQEDVGEVELIWEILAEIKYCPFCSKEL